MAEVREIFFRVELQTGKAVRSFQDLTDATKQLEKDLKKRGDIGSESFNKLKDDVTKSKQAITEFNRELRQSAPIAQRVKEGMVGAFKEVGVAVAAAFAAGAVASFFKTSIESFDKQAKAQKSLEVALGRTSTALLNQAAALQKVTLFGDETTIQAQALLAQFGLQEEQILKLTPVLQDFAAAQGIGLEEAAKLLAKSLGSSTNALSRYGIQIEGAVGSNERLDSAITALSSKFAGQATAAASAGAGAFQQFSNAVGDLKEIFGGFLVGILNPFVKGMRDLVVTVGSFIAPQKKLSETIRESRLNLEANTRSLLSDNLSQEARSKLIEQVNQQYGQYLPSLITEADSHDEIARKLKSVNEQLQLKLALASKDEAINELLEKKNSLILKEIELEAQVTKAQKEFDRLGGVEALGARQEKFEGQLTQLATQQGRLEGLKVAQSRLNVEIGNTEAKWERVIAKIKEATGITIPPPKSGTILSEEGNPLDKATDKATKAKTAIELLRGAISDLNSELENQSVTGNLSVETYDKLIAKSRELEEANQRLLDFVKQLRGGDAELIPTIEAPLLTNQTLEIPIVLIPPTPENIGEITEDLVTTEQILQGIVNSTTEVSNAFMGVADAFGASSEELQKLAATQAVATNLLNVALGVSAILRAANEPFPASLIAITSTVSAMLGAIASFKRLSSFDEGGHTGSGMFKDSTGHRVAGVVHDNEYVVPKNVLATSQGSNLVGMLEAMRRGSYAVGGFTSLPVTTPGVDLTSPQLLNALNNINFSPTVSVVEINQAQTRISEINTASEF